MKKSILIRVIGRLEIDGNDEDQEILSESRVPGPEAILDPESELTSVLGLTFPDLVTEFEDEFGVTVDLGGEEVADMTGPLGSILSVHEFDLADHPFDNEVELEECVENLGSRVEEWVRNQHS